MTSYAKDWLAADMTLRDYFAAQAAGGLLSFGAGDYVGHEATLVYASVAKDAYGVADAMLKEREKP